MKMHIYEDIRRRDSLLHKLFNRFNYMGLTQLENRTLLTIDDVKINVKKERQKLAEKGSICIFLEGLCNCNKLKNLTTHLCRICVFFWEK